MNLIEFIHKNIDIISLSEISRQADIERSKLHKNVYAGRLSDRDAARIKEILINLQKDIESIEG
jgi:hypothetical protein